jgi:ElaB/YqjD/DUF883 family membrane-anchored ribosome-binding protein
MSATTIDALNKPRTTPEELLNDSKARAVSGTDKARSEMRDFVADVEDLVKKLAHINDADITRVRAKVEDALGNARHTVEQTAKSVRNRTNAAASATDDYVRSRPWTAIGIAAAIGVLLGFTTARR